MNDENIYIIDLHGLNTYDTKIVLDEVFDYLYKEIHDYIYISFIVGIGNNSDALFGSVLLPYVQNYLNNKGYKKINIKNGIISVKIYE